MVARFLKKKKKQLPRKKGAEFRSNDLIPILLKRPVPLKIIDKYIVSFVFRTGNTTGRNIGRKNTGKLIISTGVARWSTWINNRRAHVTNRWWWWWWWTTCSILTFHHATGVTGVTLRFACKSSSTGSSTVIPRLPYTVGEYNDCRIFLQIGDRPFLREFPDWIAFNYDLVHAFRPLTHARTRINDVLIVPWRGKLLSRLWKEKHSFEA